MRAGGCTVQQALTTEAATVVKQAVTLARRRGHAQVTPLHVANTMLSSSTGLLRTACLQSHSHPLQCKALELCFNVALNRLPASSSSPILGSHHSQQYPSISNALVAAFKRAQAHQRRGSIENQQQPLLAVKIELEQLIISILDDPSVSRVMREAGFSSTQVKSNVEQAVSLEFCSQSAPNSSTSTKSKETNALALSQSKPSNPITCLDPVRDEDVVSVIDNLTNKRKPSLLIIGECLDTIEGVVKGVMDKIIKGDVPESLREVKLISFPLSSLGHFSSADLEQKFEDVKGLVRSYVNKGIVLNLGDLKWVSEYRASSSISLRDDEQRRNSSYSLCPIMHMIMELAKLAREITENSGKFWLLGIATFQTYIKCKSSHPSLETLWGLHPLTIPSNSLSLSLITDSDEKSPSASNKVDKNGSSCWTILEGDEEKQLHCCVDCTAKFETELRGLQTKTCNNDSSTSALPPWLQQYKNQNKQLNHSTNDQDCFSIKDLCKKWNLICSSIHQRPYSCEKTITFASVSPSSSTSGFSYDHQLPTLHQNHQDWTMVEPKNLWRDHHFLNVGSEPSLRMYIPEHRDNQNNNNPKPPFSSPNSTSSSDIMEMEYLHKFKELNAENLKVLCNALEKKVPWQKDIVPEIVSTILQCRSGMVRRKGNIRNCNDSKEETWLFFQGVDMEAKEKIAKELAKLIFGSHNNLVSIALSSFSSTRADSTEDCRNKRSRDEHSCSYIERFGEAISRNPHRVFFVEDVEQADYCSQIGFKRAMERGKISNINGEEADLGDAIIILSCESFSSRSRACSPPIKQKIQEQEEEEEKAQAGSSMEETSPRASLDLNISIDNDTAEDQSIDDIGLLESVDNRIIFKIQEL